MTTKNKYMIVGLKDNEITNEYFESEKELSRELIEEQLERFELSAIFNVVKLEKEEVEDESEDTKCL